MDINPYLFNEINETNNNFLVYHLFGRICSFRNSKISIIFPFIFKSFLDVFSSKKIMNTKYKSLIYIALKYLRIFLKNNQNSENSTISGNCNKIEDILFNLLYNERSGFLFEMKIYLIEEIKILTIKNSNIFSQNFLRNLTKMSNFI